MKMNKWTLALAAAGVVSLSSVAQAQEAPAGANALAASTTLSGYVSTSYTVVDGSRLAADNDSFNLDVIDLKFASNQGAGEYATGYTVELWAGPNANTLGTGDATDDIEVMQANIDLRIPVGNGLDLKVGQFQTVVGHETYNYTENAFYTRSHGFAVEPTHHTGLLASYQATDDLSLSVGVVNDTTSATTNADAGGTAYLVSLGYTVPDSAGFLSGTQLTYARVDGAGGAGVEVDNQYIGASIPLPVEGLSYNIAWDIRENTGTTADDNVVGHYLSYAASDAATINVRYEHGNRNQAAVIGGAAAVNYDGIDSVTIGLDYQLWENVISRVEYRSDDWDSNADGADESVVFNIIYSF